MKIDLSALMNGATGSLLSGLLGPGATYVKTQDGQAFFDLKRGSRCDNPDTLRRLNGISKNTFGLTLRVRRID